MSGAKKVAVSDLTSEVKVKVRVCVKDDAAVKLLVIHKIKTVMIRESGTN